MVETKRGSRHTVSERRPWANLFDSEVRRMVRNGECSPSSEMTPVTGWKKRG